MMMTAEDRKQLDRLTGRGSAKLQWVYLFAVLFNFCVAGIYLSLVGRWGSLVGYSFGHTMSVITGDLATDQTYSGFLFKANDSLTSSFAHLCLAVAFLGAFIHRYRARERAQRMINTLKRAGAW